MGAHYFQNGECRGIIHLADIYRYRGFTFEFHRYCGPMLCRSDMEPAKRQPGARSRFWPVLERWQKLPPSKRERTRIYG
jgi:hypothetical protein